MPAVAIREANQFGDNEGVLDEDDFKNTATGFLDKEADIFRANESQVSVAESGAIARPAVAIRDIELRPAYEIGNCEEKQEQEN